ncbi:MAG: GvpL/GvpF family gas vesicle protein, partial [Pseudomonadota bacterium]
MSIYLYGILQPGEGADAGDLMTGIQGVTGAVSIHPVSAMVLIYGDHDGSEILPRRRLMLAHARVLETATEAGTVLPMRFGMTCASVKEFAALAQDAGSRIRETLDRVRGHVEIGVRVDAPEEAALEAALAQSPKLAAERDRLTKGQGAAHFDKVAFGRALGDAVAERRSAAQKSLLSGLTPLCADHVLKAPETDFEPLRAE